MANLRSFPHAPDAENIQQEYDDTPELTFSVSTASPEFLANRSGLGRMMNVGWWLDMARFAYALQKSDEEVLRYLRESSDCFAWAATEGAEFNLIDLSAQFGVALILGAYERAQALGDLPPERHVQRGVTHAASAEREFEIFADLVAGRDAQATARMPNAWTTLEKSGLRKTLRENFASALDAQTQILARDQEGLVRALQRRHAAWAALVSNPQLVDDPRSLMDLNGLALCALACRAGLTPWDGSVYMPLSLLQG